MGKATRMRRGPLLLLCLCFLLAGARADSARVARFYVAGMTCQAGCAARVEDSLRGLRGVLEVQVNYSARQARVVYDPEVTGPRMIAEGLFQATGGAYPARLLEGAKT